MFLLSSTFLANKIEKSGDFVQSDDILKDVLFGARKINISSDTRSVNKKILKKKGWNFQTYILKMIYIL